MKVRPSVKKICDKCKVVRRKGVVRIICENPATSSGKAEAKKIMARIAGVDLPRHKHIVYALPYLYGIGKAAARQICDEDRHRSEQDDRGADRGRDQEDPRAPRGRLQGRGRPAPRGPDEHQAPDGPRLLPRPPSPPRPARSTASAPTPTRARARGRARASSRAPASPRDLSAESRPRSQPRHVAVEDQHPRRRPAAHRRGAARRPRPPKKKVKKNVATGIAHIQSTFNNTVVTITDVNGNTVAWSSAGSRGFKGSRKSTPFAAQLAAEEAARKAMEHGMRSVAVFVKGPGAGRESALRALQARGLQGHAHPRRHAGPPQRLPPAQAPPRLIRMHSRPTRLRDERFGA